MLQDPTFWILVSLVLFFAFMWWKARGAITGTLDSRVEQVKTELDEAAQLKEAAREALAEQRKLNRQAAEKADAMLKEAKQEAEFQLQRAEKKLKTTIAQREQQAMQRLEQAEAAAMAEVAEKTVQLTMSVSRQILADQMRTTVGETVIDKAIKDVSALARQA